MESDQSQNAQTPPTPPSESPESTQSNGSKLDSILGRPCKITNVNFSGVKKTRPNVLAKIVADVFPARDITDLVERVMTAKAKLVTLNAFNEIDVLFDEIGNDDVEVTFALKENGPIIGSTETSVDNHSQFHFNIGLKAPNLNGIGDSLQASASLYTHAFTGDCSYSVPLAPWRTLFAPRYSIIYSQYRWDTLPSKIDREDRSVVNQVDFLSLPQLHHSISFENIWRCIKSSSPTATPISIREQCGHSVKSSLNHTMTWDNREGGSFPYEGILAKLSNEFTANLVNNSARFTRHEVNLQFNSMLLPQIDLLCQANLLAGTLFRPHRVNICDKFFAGGPLTLRGFKYQGLEPNVQECPLGEASYMSAGIHIYSILPFTTPASSINQFVRPHIFLNTGTIGDIHTLKLTSRDDAKREAIRFKESLRYSCGLGLVAYFRNMRLELNYCIPLAFRRGDLLDRGFQWGFGLTYT